ncbi:MAG: glycosyltransferase [candidate division SR1 bacterium]|nr:glycosyltransferase [candidate division SR1 bacterium]
MFINIVTPTFDTYLDLLDTANSIIEIKKVRQDLSICWIIIDNMSTDHTQDILHTDKYKKIVDIMVVEQDNGIYDAMNKGLNLCRNGHVLFLGVGDKIIQLPKEIDHDTVYYGTTIVDNSRYYKSTIHNYIFNKFNTLHHQSMLTPIKFHSKFSLEYSTCSDYAHNLEMLITGRRFQFDENLLAYHKPGGRSSNLDQVKEECKTIQKKFLDMIKSEL